MSKIKIQTDIFQDIAKSSSSFSTCGKCIQEFVWNSIECRRDGEMASVEIIYQKDIRRLLIRDKGKGMTSEGIMLMLRLHANNRNNAHGRNLRSFFGTGGKYAAFSLAEEIVIRTVKNELLTEIRIVWDDYKDVGPASELDVEELNVDTPVKEESGTTIIFQGLKKNFADAEVSSFLRKSLHHMLRDHVVMLNGKRVTFEIPDHDDVLKVRAPISVEKVVGSPLELTLYHSKKTLPRDMWGVTVLVNTIAQAANVHGDIPHESRMRTFGVLVANGLDSPDIYGVQSYGQTRDLSLNEDSIKVYKTYEWMFTEMQKFAKKHQSASIANTCIGLDQFQDVINEAMNGIYKKMFGQDDELSSTNTNKKGAVEGLPRVPTTGEGTKKDPPETPKKRKQKGMVGMKFVEYGPDDDIAYQFDGSGEVHCNLNHPAFQALLPMDSPEFQLFAATICLEQLSHLIVRREMEKNEEDMDDAMIFVNRISSRSSRVFAEAVPVLANIKKSILLGRTIHSNLESFG